MDLHKWTTEAMRWALHAYCYEGMVEEFPEEFDRLFRAGRSPYEAVDEFAEDAGLDRVDGFYGIHSNKEFIRDSAWRSIPTTERD